MSRVQFTAPSVDFVPLRANPRDEYEGEFDRYEDEYEDEYDDDDDDDDDGELTGDLEFENFDSNNEDEEEEEEEESNELGTIESDGGMDDGNYGNDDISSPDEDDDLF
ncbi:uncharacterized protein METZ01_LOCUS301012 [marine metagenome]|uniref:Uncharacterized protein n=1 Tax=marine metagenome TaxID=408172 RepID=A0A382MI40_9ZZZZ